MSNAWQTTNRLDKARSDEEASVHPPLAKGTRVKVARLTLGELWLLHWLADGRTNAQIARCLGRSEKTVRNQLTRVYAKLGTTNRVEAAAAYLLGRF